MNLVIPGKIPGAAEVGGSEVVVLRVEPLVGGAGVVLKVVEIIGVVVIIRSVFCVG